MMDIHSLSHKSLFIGLETANVEVIRLPVLDDIINPVYLNDACEPCRYFHNVVLSPLCSPLMFSSPPDKGDLGGWGLGGLVLGG